MGVETADLETFHELLHAERNAKDMAKLPSGTLVGETSGETRQDENADQPPSH